MSSSQHNVILFTRYPSPGKCKTRLIPELGPDGAARIHRQLTAQTMDTLDIFLHNREDTDLTIYHDGGSRQQMQQWLGSDHHYREQQGMDLGQRMANALSDELYRDKNCILIGSDCPDTTATILSEALQALKTKDLVLGPAHDGGYYLIGTPATTSLEIRRQLFPDIAWGGTEVYRKTLQRVKQLGLHPHILTTLHDIDCPADLHHFHHRPHSK